MVQFQVEFPIRHPVRVENELIYIFSFDFEIELDITVKLPGTRQAVSIICFNP